MKITKLKEGRNQKIHVYLEEEYALTVTRAIAAEHGLQVGMELEEGLASLLCADYQQSKARDKAFRLLGMRDHSSQELFQKLSRDFPPELAEETVEELLEEGYLDDARFAADYAAYLQRTKRMAASRILLELRRKGVERETAQQALEQLEEDPQQQIAELLRRKYAGCLTEEKGRRRAIQALMRLGYQCHDIFEVLDGAAEDFEE